MNAEMNSSFMTLDRRQIIELADGAGGAITCLAGTLWVTRQGGSEDIILAPGQSVRLDGTGSAVVQGLTSSTLRVTRRAEASWFASWKKLAVSPLARHFQHLKSAAQ